MANSSIKLINKNIYTVDIKDEYDNVIHTLKFHLNDANFPVKMLELYDKANKEIINIKAKEDELKQKILEEGNTEVPAIDDITIENIESIDTELSPAMKEFFTAEAQAYQSLREILDDFLGKGTCQAIFGEHNDRDMFTEFLEGLLPEFEKMGIKMVNIQQNMYKKYSPKANKVI